VINLHGDRASRWVDLSPIAKTTLILEFSPDVSVNMPRKSETLNPCISRLLSSFPSVYVIETLFLVLAGYGAKFITILEMSCATHRTRAIQPGVSEGFIIPLANLAIRLQSIFISGPLVEILGALRDPTSTTDLLHFRGPLGS
jgi:hypothetical protein